MVKYGFARTYIMNIIFITHIAVKHDFSTAENVIYLTINMRFYLKE